MNGDFFTSPLDDKCAEKNNFQTIEYDINDGKIGQDFPPFRRHQRSFQESIMSRSHQSIPGKTTRFSEVALHQVSFIIFYLLFDLFGATAKAVSTTHAWQATTELSIHFDEGLMVL